MDFQYTVRDPLGNTHKGTVEAISREDAVQSLYRDGFQVTKIEEVDDSFGLFPRGVRKSEIVYTTSQLAIMVDTGINLAAAIEGLRQQEQNPTLKRLLADLKSDVEAGEDFSAALAKYPKYFDKTFIALVKSSERTGSLGQMLEQISDYLGKELDNRGKVRSALAYPTIVLVLAVGVTIFLLTYIMPKFAPLFSRRGVQLPKLTLVMMHVSEVLIQYWYAWSILAVLLVAGVLVGRRTEPGRKVLDWLRINAPILGKMFRKVIISRCIRTLGTMLQNGVAMLDALQLTSEVSANYYYEKSWLHVLQEVTNGNKMCEAMAANTLFPKTLVQMISAGEETGRLDYVLNKVSAYYDREVETALKTTTSMIEPLMISVMGIVVGSIGLSLLLPIFTLSRGH